MSVKLFIDHALVSSMRGMSICDIITYILIHTYIFYLYVQKKISHMLALESNSIQFVFFETLFETKIFSVSDKLN